MPKPPNRALRLAVPLLVGVLGAFVVYAVFLSSKPKPALTPTPTQTEGATTSAAPATPPSGTEPAPQTSASQTSAPQTSAPQPSAPQPSAPQPAADPALTTPAGLEGERQRASANADAPATLGTLTVGVWPTVGDDANLTLESDKVRVRLSPVGGGIESITLREHHETIRREHEVVPVRMAPPLAEGQPSMMVPFAAVSLEVTPEPVPGQPAVTPYTLSLYANTAGVVWHATNPGVLEAVALNSDGQPAITITRQFSVEGHNVWMRQRIQNLTSAALSVRLVQLGVTDPPMETIAYGGDKRRVRFGSMLPAAFDPSQRAVSGQAHERWRQDSLPGENALALSEQTRLWPDQAATKDARELVWMGMTSRYWGVAAGVLSAPDAIGAAKQLNWVEGVYAQTVQTNTETMLGMMVRSEPLALAPAGQVGAARGLDMGIYAGPLDRVLLMNDSWRASINLKDLVIYNFGGPCGFCTFQSVANGLLGLLRLLHDYLFKDWAMAIIMLVVIVRTVLHPVTKWSQIRMARFGKQMGAMGPKIKEIQEKYKNEPMKVREETTRLWAQEGVSPTGMLGCLPMFLQTPVWIALSAALYFSVELRHQGAFWGLFQSIQPQSSPFWQFLGDLSEPDRLIYFGRSIISLPMLGEIRSINILPIVLGVVFFMQQKYLTPPQTTAMTPEQEMQMKMFKFMSVFMFPLFMYQAPSGLSLYFIANSVLAILESKWIRSHMDKHGLLDLDKMKAERANRKKGKQGSFLERMQAIAAEQERKRKEALRNKK